MFFPEDVSKKYTTTKDSGYSMYTHQTRQIQLPFGWKIVPGEKLQNKLEQKIPWHEILVFPSNFMNVFVMLHLFRKTYLKVRTKDKWPVWATSLICC